MSANYSPTEIAIYFINKGDVSNMKLNKLLYFTQGWYMAYNDGETLFDEDFEAWEYGPVLPSIYFQFRIFGRNTIPKDDLPWLTSYESSRVAKNEEIIGFLDSVWEVFGHKSAIELVNETHLNGTPWKQVYNSNVFSVDIPKKLIFQYFAGLKNELFGDK